MKDIYLKEKRRYYFFVLSTRRQTDLNGMKLKNNEYICLFSYPAIEIMSQFLWNYLKSILKFVGWILFRPILV
jgi:hypothetical protein